MGVCILCQGALPLTITGGRSGVIADVKPGEKVFGYPAKPWKESMRSSMYVKRLGGLYQRVKKLEAQASADEEDAASDAADKDD